jgi:RND family efflux transporter MFP subunit
MKHTLLLALLTWSACAKPGSEEPHAPPAAQVELRTLVTAPQESFSDYLATLTSRRSVTLYSQVSGYVRSIAARSGATVKQGSVVLSVDARADEASLQNLLATRETQKASVAFAKERLDRATTLRADGIVSQQDLDQARVTAEQAESTLKATDALIASQRARLGFYDILAPFEGVLGHVPVKVGDFVTPATPLSSVTQNSGLEAEVWVPLERVSSLGPDSVVRLVQADGALIAESPVSFVAPRADAASQLVLIKASFEPNPALRADQLVHVRVVWNRHDGVSVPANVVVRQAGQTFVFVAKKVDSGLTAQRVPVELGALQDGEYQVRRGVQAGDQLVVSGVQMVNDGAPIEVKK